MTINETIQAWHHAQLQVEMLESLPNSQYDPAKHYAAITAANVCLYRMLNHPDWTSQLQDEHYPSGIGDIGYPVSC